MGFEDTDSRRLLHSSDGDYEQGSSSSSSRIGKMNQTLNVHEVLGRKWHRSLKLSLVALVFVLASVISLGTWYYTVGRGENAAADVLGIDITDTSSGETETTACVGSETAATEWYAPGKIKPTSKDPSLPRTFLWPIDDMVRLREFSKKGNDNEVWGRPHRRTVMWLRRNVYDTLDEGKLYSVLDQNMTPRSGDKHDYQSMGFYWWPCTQALKVCGLEVPDFYEKTCDPKTDLPWVLCDGKDNEKTRDYSSKNSMQLMTWDATELALLYWYTGEEQYAKRAKELLRFFFLDPDTAMTPHLEYAQWVPGLEEFDEVNGYGIIEIKDWSELLDAVAIIRQSPHWDLEKDDKPLMDWFRRLLAWMLASHKGNLERHHHNNHAVWFYQTAISIALHIGDVYTARMLAYDINNMIDHQIMRDGTLPLELERPRKIHYTCYAMTAFYRVARLCEAVGVNVFNHNTSTIAPHVTPAQWNHLKESIKFVLPFMSKKDVFPMKDTDVERGNKGAVWQRCLEPLAIAQTAWPDDKKFQKEMADAVLSLLDDYWIEPRIYGQPVYAVYDMFRKPWATALAGNYRKGEDEIREKAKESAQKKPDFEIAAESG